jgi:hypothetical protein
MIEWYSVGPRIFDEPSDAAKYATKYRHRFFYGFTIAGHVVRLSTTTSEPINDHPYIDAPQGVDA